MYSSILALDLLIFHIVIGLYVMTQAEYQFLCHFSSLFYSIVDWHQNTHHKTDVRLGLKWLRANLQGKEEANPFMTHGSYFSGNNFIIVPKHERWANVPKKNHSGKNSKEFCLAQNEYHSLSPDFHFTAVNRNGFCLPKVRAILSQLKMCKSLDVSHSIKFSYFIGM